MPESEIKQAFAEAAGTDLLIVVGSSLQVYPAAAIPNETRQAGGWVVIINKEPTAQDSTAGAIIRGPAGEVLKELAAKAEA
ncbi:NAD-dependent protein deacetylase [subsurface metagenome]